MGSSLHGQVWQESHHYNYLGYTDWGEVSTLFTRYPWIQDKVQEELDQVVGGDRCPGLADRTRLPYTEAVLMEVQRHAHVLPLGVRHRSAGAQF